MAFMNAKKRNKTIIWILVAFVSLGLLASVSFTYLGTAIINSNTNSGSTGVSSGSPEYLADQDFDAAMNLLQQNKLDDAGKKFDSAIKGYEEVLKKDPNNIQVLGDLATSYFYIGNTDKAIELAKKTLAIRPDYSLVRINYSKYLFYGKNDSVEALNQLKQIGKDDVNYQEAQSMIDEINKSQSLPPKGNSLPPQGGNTLPPQGGVTPGK